MSTTDTPRLLTIPQLARWTLTSFVLTFLTARICVLLIMTRRMPDLYLFVGQTHVHHLNYGIFLLVGVGGWLLFRPPNDAAGQRNAAVAYGVGLGLTFDEFGLWLHLGGSYWQRASYDAIVTIGGLLGLLAFVPNPRHFRVFHWIWAAIILLAFITFAILVADRLQVLAPLLRQIEQSGPR